MEMKDGEITRLNVDGKEIPASEFDQYNELAEELQRSTPPIPYRRCHLSRACLPCHPCLR
ncbi:MAG: hypothetical protein IPL27_16360 [Lewinellaceae bacterium]|nr:hypothetical protein [Lewinellaceae bacterium]